jgi:hypothetical protein
MTPETDHIETNLAAPDMDFIVPAADTAKDFGNIAVRKKGDRFLVQLSLMVNPINPPIKAWHTGVALDASSSMKNVYGRRLLGNIPKKLASEYEFKSWLQRESRDGRKIYTMSSEAANDALKRKLLTKSPNLMDFIAPEFIAHLAGKWDINDKTALIYWAGGTGSEIEPFDDFGEFECANLNIDGPNKMMFGTSTRIVPALKHLVDRFKDQGMGLYLFITDGRIDDLAKVKQYSLELGSQMYDNRCPPLKLIIVGIGDESDETQLAELDEINKQIFINLWDHMQVDDLQDVLAIFSEVVRENRIIAPGGTIYDGDGNVLKQYPAGMPTRVSFAVPVKSSCFEIESNGQRWHQLIKIPKYSL